MAEPTTPTVLPHLLVIEDDYRDLALFMAEEPRSAEDIEQYRAENMRMRLWCPGVTDHCRMWLACDDKDHEHPDRDSDEWDEGEATIGGIEHRVIAYDWMTRTESCLVVSEGFEGGDAWDLANEVGYIPGVYPVEHDWDDAIYLSLDASGTDVEPLIEAALGKAPLDPCPRCSSHEIAEAHDPCCSSHNRPMCHRCYSRTHFVETGCCGPEYAVIRVQKEPAAPTTPVKAGDLVRLEAPGALIEAEVVWVNPRSGHLSLQRIPQPLDPKGYTVTVVDKEATHGRG